MASQEVAAGAGLIFVLLFMLVALALMVVSIVAAWKIVGKTGNPGVLSLLYLIPIAGFVLILYLAFSEWPIERELREAKGASSGGRPFS